jgi:hypothetical protein
MRAAASGKQRSLEQLRTLTRRRVLLGVATILLAIAFDGLVSGIRQGALYDRFGTAEFAIDCIRVCNERAALAFGLELGVYVLAIVVLAFFIHRESFSIASLDHEQVEIA